MKTYEEMAQNVLMRGKAIAEQRNKMNKILLGVITGLVVCCLVILLVSGVGENSPNPEPVGFLAAVRSADPGMSGASFQYIAGSQNPNEGSAMATASRRFLFDARGIHVVAKVTEDLGIYETLNEYGSIGSYSYRLLRMKVIDSLQSGIEGSFYYILPASLKGDLTRYDALLISMEQCPRNFVLRCGDELTAFAYLFADPLDTPQWGNILAFNNGVFDEFFWLNNGWFSIINYELYYAYYRKAYSEDSLLVSKGSTLEEALQRRLIQLAEWADGEFAEVKHYDFQTNAARQAVADREPFENGLFVPERNGQDYCLRRYIKGCPTNEWVLIDYDTETVTTSEHSFENADIEKLPDIPAYIANLNLTQIAPQHIDTTGKDLTYISAAGWYEKTESGVYSIIRISWCYQYDLGSYYDETFILLDESGDHIISRENLTELIGENPNISYEEYGVGYIWME